MNRQQTLHIPHSDYFTFLLYWVRQAEGEDQAHQLKHVETARIFWHHLDWVKLSTKFRVNKILRSSLIKPSVYIMFREISWTPLVLRAHLDKECGDHQCHERGDVVRQVVADDGHAALAVHLQVHLNTSKCQEPRLKWDRPPRADQWCWGCRGRSPRCRWCSRSPAPRRCWTRRRWCSPSRGKTGCRSRTAGQVCVHQFNIATGYLQILTLLNMEKLQSWLITIKPSVSLARIVRLNRKQIRNLNEEI